MMIPRKTIGKVEFLGSFSSDFPNTGLPEIAFAGRSNVGKSAALNCLLGHNKAARVSARPGRTQSINLFRIDDALCVADLPGYGFARVPAEIRQKWKESIDHYLAMRELLRMIVLLVDVRLDAQEMDMNLIAALVELKLPTLVVATKIDKLSKSARIPRLRALENGLSLPSDALVGFSAVTGEGREEIWARIQELTPNG